MTPIRAAAPFYPAMAAGRTYGLSYAEAAKARAVAMKELRARGKVERLIMRSRYVRFFA